MLGCYKYWQNRLKSLRLDAASGIFQTQICGRHQSQSKIAPSVKVFFATTILVCVIKALLRFKLRHIICKVGDF
jgi:hypothetical protein